MTIPLWVVPAVICAAILTHWVWDDARSRRRRRRDRERARRRLRLYE